MAKIGYIEGTDLEVLDKLALQGQELVPLGKDKNGYRENLFEITRFDKIDIVLTRFYRLKQLARSYGASVSVADAFERCREAGTQIIVVAPSDSWALMKKELRDKGVEEVKFVSREKLPEEINNLLERRTPRTEKQIYGYAS